MDCEGEASWVTDMQNESDCLGGSSVDNETTV